ncbi:hypothetical protein SAMN05216359_102445 [Roseateles sp. YR242]|uniref:hypothetical protein n=1 Tax=Roseateles sp. YR242 TaxID=1855305 RepID=UPI0008AEB5E8|nr:hypothetical protein [Roseateles sp. YR242]SEK62580.1 hypothetical protein SAMN05216359_102445 [Roseateles sp. YR242]
MCHPAASRIDGDAIADARRREFLVWADPAMHEALKQRDVQLMPMSVWLQQRSTIRAAA